jgi:hypothetical protein
MILLVVCTFILAVLVGRHTNARGLIVASTAVLLGSVVVLAPQNDGFALWLLTVLNVAVFEIIAVTLMLLLPSVHRLEVFSRTQPVKSATSK